MGRICDAIDVLFNGLPAKPDPAAPAPAVPDPIISEGTRDPLVKYVPSGDGMISVFIAKSKIYQSDWALYAKMLDLDDMHRLYPGVSSIKRREPPVAPDWHNKAFLSCAQAFDECGEGMELTNAKAFIADGKAYVVVALRPHDLAPKPKVAKGKRPEAAQ